MIASKKRLFRRNKKIVDAARSVLAISLLYTPEYVTTVAGTTDGWTIILRPTVPPQNPGSFRRFDFQSDKNNHSPIFVLTTIYTRMWTRLKKLIHVQLPVIQQTEGYSSTQSIKLSDLQVRNSKLLKRVIPGNDRLTMSFSSSSSVTSEHQKEGFVEGTIRQKLVASLSPVTHLTILNESHRHNV